MFFPSSYRPNTKYTVFLQETPCSKTEWKEPSVERVFPLSLYCKSFLSKGAPYSLKPFNKRHSFSEQPFLFVATGCHVHKSDRRRIFCLRECKPLLKMSFFDTTFVARKKIEVLALKGGLYLRGFSFLKSSVCSAIYTFWKKSYFRMTTSWERTPFSKKAIL